jgi:hypothetical protein
MVKAKITAAQPSRSGPPLPLLLSIVNPTHLAGEVIGMRFAVFEQQRQRKDRRAAGVEK